MQFHRIARAAVFGVTCSLALASFVTKAKCETLGEEAARLGVPMMQCGIGWCGVQWDWATHDVNGQIGYPLAVSPPTTNCPLGGGWSGNVEIQSGQMPPGLTLQNDLTISGYPTAPGHWIVTFALKNIMCGGHQYTIGGEPDVVLQANGVQGADTCVDGDLNPMVAYCALRIIRFHISGSGAVVQ
jgi:hypothetical protein